MVSRIRKTAVTALAVAGLAAGLAMSVPGSASAAILKPNINQVPCSSNSYLHVWFHQENASPRQYEWCFANGGTVPIYCPGGCWLDALSTGNNLVQWYGDGRWQPQPPIGKNTYYYFPNHPGGVSFEKIAIV